MMRGWEEKRREMRKNIRKIRRINGKRYDPEAGFVNYFLVLFCLDFA